MNYRGDFGQKRLPNLENRSDVLRQIDRKRKTERTGKNQNKNKALLETGSVDENRNLDSGAIKDHTHTHTHTHPICNHNAISRKDIYITEKTLFTLDQNRF